MAEPRDACVGRDESDRALVGEKGVPLDRRSRVPFEPRPAAFEEVGEEPGNGVCVRESGPSARRAGPDLHAEVRTPQGRERVLVGQVVTEEDHAIGADQLSEAAQRGALVGLDERQLEHHLAPLGADPREPPWTVEHLLHQH